MGSKDKTILEKQGTRQIGGVREIEIVRRKEILTILYKYSKCSIL